MGNFIPDQAHSLFGPPGFTQESPPQLEILQNMKHVLAPSMLAIAGLAASASAQIVIGPTNTPFTDISVTGTSPGTATDDSEITVTSATLGAAGWLGNDLVPAGKAIRIGNNGAVLIGAGTALEVGYTNSTIFPTMTASNTTVLGNGGTIAGTAMLCPLWDDNTPTSGQGANTLDWQVIGGNLIVQWTNEDHFNATGLGTVTYQAVIYGGATIASGAPLVDFVYQDTLYQPMQYQNDGGSATIGYKNWSSIAGANDVEFGNGGGTNSLADPAFGDASMRPKVAGYLASETPALPNAVRISGNAVTPPVPYCFGDGTGIDCASIGAGCANGAAGNGCASSVNAAGGNLTATGTSSIAADTLVLVGTGMPNSSALYFQGTTQISTIFGDGIRCAGGTVIRLGTKANAAGASQYPAAGDPSVSVRGLVGAAGTRTYQVWYRNAASFCTSATFNLTNGLLVTWF